MSKDITLSSGRVLVGDCVARMRNLPDCSVDAVVTDPPYGIEFMGKEWDSFATSVDPRTAGRTGKTKMAKDGKISKDSRTPQGRTGVAFGGSRPRTSRCSGCGKRDQFRNSHECAPDASWQSEVIDPHAAPPSMLTFQAWFTEVAAEAYRVLKPGGHLLAFGGTRTYHRMACAIEDAGFEIRDSIHWVYGSGFPKSLDVSKAIDKQRHKPADVLAVVSWLKKMKSASGASASDFDEAFGTANVSQYWFSEHRNPRVPTLEQVPTLLDVLGVNADEVPADVRRLLWDLNGRKGQPGENWAKREVVGTDTKARSTSGASALPTVGGETVYRTWDVTAPATDEARRWEGWGTALKPAHEPIVVARKPLAGTVAGNVLTFGTGALNIDGARVGGTNGRWPANVIFDTAAGHVLDQQNEGASQFFTCADYGQADVVPFIYQAKPSRAERNAGTDANVHPTVKPVALMRHLVRLVTPPGGTVLDPFLGSGTTAVATTLEGFQWIGCEMTDEYLPIIKGRIAWAEAEVAAGRAEKPQYKKPTAKPTPQQPTLTEDGQQQ